MSNIYFVTQDGMEDAIQCDNFTWHVDTQTLSFYQVLEEGEYKPSAIPGRLDVVKPPKSQLIAVVLKPQYWKEIPENDEEEA